MDRGHKMTKKAVPVPTKNIDLVKQYHLYLTGFAVVSRETVLKNIARASCMTERVYWVLILSSWCGPHVQEACWLRDEQGYLAKDPLTGEHIPLRLKHVLKILKLDHTGRANVARCMKLLQRQKRIVLKDGVCYPVLSAPVKKGTEGEKVISTDSILPYTFRWMGFNLNLSTINDECRPALIQKLACIRDRTNTAIKEARACAKKDVGLLLSEFPSLLEESEEIEEIEEGEEGAPEGALPLPSNSTVPAEPDPEPVALVVSDEPERKLVWDAWLTLMAKCGKPVSVERMEACRDLFWSYPLEQQQRILLDATLRSVELWNEPRFTPAPLKYLKSRDWDVNPLRQRTLPKVGNSQQQQRNDALRRNMERALARDREEEEAAAASTAAR